MKEKEFIISYKKIIMNLARLWWIIIVSLLVGVCFIVVLSKKSNGDSVSNVGVARINVSYYGVPADIIDVNYNDVQSSNYAILVNSGEVRSMANEKLRAAGFEEINSSDVISSFTESRNVVNINVTSSGDKERLRVMCDALAEGVVSLGQESYQYTVAKVIDAAHVESNVTENQNSDFNAKKKLAVAALFVCIGIFIICMFIAFDRKVYVKQEVTDNLTYLGLLKSKGKENEITAATINALIKESGYKSVIVTTPGKAYDTAALEELAKKLTCEKAEILPGIENNPETLTGLNNADAVIMLVKAGRDNVNMIDTAASRIQLIKANVMGYVLAE
ncbi:MAG: hypothetical protein ACI4E1_09240 [Lachnospira sp.]